ncbi:MAG: hypothetical protein HC828_10515, partial [Blastochloris sp.]|nr:hypothetical protein [Blastochloris sp.]
MTQTTERPTEIITTALSADIRLLGGLLGQVIRDQHGVEAFDLVEQVRRWARARRARSSTMTPEEAETMLRDSIEAMPLDELRILIKAFSNYFQLINIAEDLQRIRVLREREAQNDLSETIDDAIRLLSDAGLSAD